MHEYTFACLCKFRIILLVFIREEKGGAEGKKGKPHKEEGKKGEKGKPCGILKGIRLNVYINLGI